MQSFFLQQKGKWLYRKGLGDIGYKESTLSCPETAFRQRVEVSGLLLEYSASGGSYLPGKESRKSVRQSPMNSLSPLPMPPWLPKKNELREIVREFFRLPAI